MKIARKIGRTVEAQIRAQLAAPAAPPPAPTATAQDVPSAVPQAPSGGAWPQWRALSVREQVIQRILAMKTFTISELVRFTGCNQGSVRTVVQRLRQDEFVASGERQETSSAPSGFGAPVVQYHLTDDEEKLRELRSEVPVDLASEPLDEEVVSSLDFEEAHRYLEAAFRPRTLGETRRSYADEASAHLAIVESMAEEAGPRVRATVGFERGRVYLARGQAKEAYEKFAELLPQFGKLSAGAQVNACYHYLFFALSTLLGHDKERALARLQTIYPEFHLSSEVALAMEQETSLAEEQETASAEVELS